MERQQSNESIEEIRVKMERDADVKEEQPDLFDAGDNILDFDEDIIRFIKPERSDPVEPNFEEKANGIELKEFEILLTKFDNFSCIVCDRVLGTTGPMPVCKHNEKILLICNECKYPKGKKCTCVKCDRSFSQRRELIDHVNGFHRKLKTYKCGECKSAFTMKTSLKIHVDSIHYEQKYACQECKKVYSRRSQLNNHVNFAHRHLKMFTCSECNKAFPTRWQFERHIDGVHRRMREYSCEQCKSVFFIRGNLTRHVDIIHRKLNPFECEKCNRQFGQKWNLKKHINKFHLK